MGANSSSAHYLHTSHRSRGAWRKRGTGGDEISAREEVHRFAERAQSNERDRVAYPRSLAVLSECEGDTQRAIDHLHEALTLAQKMGVPGGLWRIRSRIIYLHERRGENALRASPSSGAAQTLRPLAQKNGGEKISEGFLSAPQVRRVLGRN
jgi:hypothetical protein